MTISALCLAKPFELAPKEDWENYAKNDKVAEVILKLEEMGLQPTLYKVGGVSIDSWDDVRFNVPTAKQLCELYAICPPSEMNYLDNKSPKFRKIRFWWD